MILTTDRTSSLGLPAFELSLLPRTGINLMTPGQTAATELVLLESIDPGGLVHVPEVLAVGDLLAGDQAVPPLPDMTAVTDWTGFVLILLLPDSIILFICRPSTRGIIRRDPLTLLTALPIAVVGADSLTIVTFPFRVSEIVSVEGIILRPAPVTPLLSLLSFLNLNLSVH